MTASSSPRDQHEHSSDQQPLIENRFVLLVALISLLASIWFAFLVPAETGDTFMTLAGGRDVVEGKLAQPDDWSFMTEGRVWINQSWGTGLLFYQLWKHVGFVGIVIVKAVMICLIGLFLVLAARQFGTTYSVGLIVAAFVIASEARLINMRANLNGLAMFAALLWLIYCSYGRPHRIWFAVVLLTFWAHVHGSFIFGIAVLGLWTVVYFGVLLWQRRPIGELKHLWPLPAATALALILAAATSPFGIRNLTQPFSLLGFFVEEKWPIENREMWPIFIDHPLVYTIPGIRWLLFMLGGLAAAIYLRVKRPTIDIPRIVDLDDGQRIKWLFTFSLAAVSVLMAVQAQRFIPICLIACAPLLAFELQWLLDHRRYAWPTVLIIAACAAVGILMEQLVGFASGPMKHLHESLPTSTVRRVWGATALILALSPVFGFWLFDYFLRNARTSTSADQSAPRGWTARLQDRWWLGWSPLILALTLLGVVIVQVRRELPYHQANYPVFEEYDIFERLVVMGHFPQEAAEFLKLNDISGNAFSAWQQEGYLHWSHPKLKVMVGGRSRQVYSADAALKYKLAKTTDDVTLLSKLGIQLIVLPVTEPQAAKLIEAQDTPWRIIYYDGRTVIAANQDDSEAGQLVRDAEAGSLIYPSEKSKKYSLAAQRLVLSSDSSAQEIMESLTAAAQIHPPVRLYQALVLQKNTSRVATPQMAAFFEAELIRLHGRDCRRPLGFEELQSRRFLANVLSDYYSNLTPPNRKRRKFWKEYSEQCLKAAIAIGEGRPQSHISDIPAEYTAAAESAEP